MQQHTVWRTSGVRRWPLWSVERSLLIYVVAVVVTALAMIIVELSRTALRQEELLTFVLLIGCGAVSVEASRRLGRPAGTAVNNLLSAWWLPIAFLLPPVYALLSPIPLLALTQWRDHRTALHRRVFSAAAIGLAHGAASYLFHALSDAWSLQTPGTGTAAVQWTLLAAGCAALALSLNSMSIVIAVTAQSPETSWSQLLFSRECLTLQATELCTGLLIALVVGVDPRLALVALIPVLILQRSLLHDQLSTAARCDAKTGLLNATTWERETTSEIARAYRSHSPLAVLLMDIDLFKRVNDEHGHLAGDEVLKAVAHTVRTQLRPYDLPARFGGEEFAVLLPQTDEVEALRTAERLRRHIAALRVPNGESFMSVTISIGVACLDGPDQLASDLLMAADSALYRAKAEGRDRVEMVSRTVTRRD